MAPTFIPLPEEYNKKDISGKTVKESTFVQFVPGIVTEVVTGEDSIDGSNLVNIGSIKAKAHFGDDGLDTNINTSEKNRYLPLLRGIQEVPTPGD